MKYEIKTQLQISEFFPDFDEWNISIVSTVSLKTEYRFFFYLILYMILNLT